MSCPRFVDDLLTAMPFVSLSTELFVFFVLATDFGYYPATAEERRKSDASRSAGSVHVE